MTQPKPKRTTWVRKTAKDMPPVYRAMVDALTVRRKELGWTQEALAHVIQTGQASISSYEAGIRVANFHTLTRWAEALGTNFEVVLKVTDDVAAP